MHLQGLSLHFWLSELGITQVEKSLRKSDRTTSPLLRLSHLPGVWEALDCSPPPPPPNTTVSLRRSAGRAQKMPAKGIARAEQHLASWKHHADGPSKNLQITECPPHAGTVQALRAFVPFLRNGYYPPSLQMGKQRLREAHGDGQVLPTL